MSVVGDAPTGHVGKAMRRKEDPRLITGRARYIDDISLPGTLWASLVRSPEAHAKIVSIDTSAASARPGMHARVHRARTWPIWAARCPWPGPRPGSRWPTPSTGRWPAGRSTMSAIPWPWSSARIATRSRTRPRTCSSSTSRCPSWSTRRRRSRAQPVGARIAGHQQGARVVAARRRRRGRFRRGRRGRRAARGQPPHRRGADRVPRRAGRLPGRFADPVDLHPGAPLRPPVHGPAARACRGSRAGDRSRGGRRFRLKAPGLRRGADGLLGLAQAGAAGEVDRDPDREHGRRPPGPRPDLPHQDGRQARRHDHRLPREDRGRLRGLQHAPHAADPIAGGVRDGGLLQDPQRPDRHQSECSPTSARPTPSAVPAGPRRPTCSS